MINFADLTRAEMAAVIVETLSAHGIEVALVGGGCVCVYTNGGLVHSTSISST